jgi:asparagine synthase (glutamine-hydrolysing)
MRAAVPVGCLLSGGLDSSTMLGLAASFNDKPLTAFTIAFDDEQYDESPRARQTAQHVGASHHVLPVRERDLADHFEESVWQGEGLQYNAHGTARFLLSRAIAQAGFRAVMGGEGADEAFAGYGFLRGLVLARVSPGLVQTGLRFASRFLRPMNPTERLVARTSPWLAQASKLFGLPAEVSARAVEWLELLRSILAAGYLAQFRGRDPYREFFSRFEVRSKLLGREPAKQIIYVWLRSIFVNYHMAADRLDMAHAVEVRLPFLDHKLFEFASQIPVSLLAKGGQQKHVLREVGRRYVPESVYSGPKKPFWAPPSTRRGGNALYELIQETLRGPMLDALPFFDQKAVVALLDRLPTLDDAGRAALDPLLMAIASMCVLQRRYRL